MLAWRSPPSPGRHASIAPTKATPSPTRLQELHKKPISSKRSPTTAKHYQRITVGPMLAWRSPAAARSPCKHGSYKSNALLSAPPGAAQETHLQQAFSHNSKTLPTHHRRGLCLHGVPPPPPDRHASMAPTKATPSPTRLQELHKKPISSRLSPTAARHCQRIPRRSPCLHGDHPRIDSPPTRNLVPESW